jgi:hypothetical protein
MRRNLPEQCDDGAPPSRKGGAAREYHDDRYFDERREDERAEPHREKHGLRRCFHRVRYGHRSPRLGEICPQLEILGHLPVRMPSSAFVKRTPIEHCDCISKRIASARRNPGERTNAIAARTGEDVAVS